MKHKELKELKKLLEKDKVTEKSLKKIFDILEKMLKSNKSDFKEAFSLCSKVSKKMKSNKNGDKKLSKKLDEKLEKLSKSLKKQKPSKKEEKKTKQQDNKKLSKPLSVHSKRVTKSLMIQTISDKASLSKHDAGIALNTILETITESLTNGDNVTLIGFGTFTTSLRAARDGFNPYSKEKMRIPEHKIAKFRVGSKLKEALK